jgi:hypothetical protein
MKTTNDGGPAFPLMGESNHPDGGRYLFNQGMTLRDYFAGQALAGLMSDQTIKAMPEDFAESAYLAADAMLAAREGKQ